MCGNRGLMFKFICVLFFVNFCSILASENVTDVPVTEPQTGAPTPTRAPTKDVNFKVIHAYVRGLNTTWAAPADLKPLISSYVVHYCEVKHGDNVHPGGECNRSYNLPFNATSYFISKLHSKIQYCAWLEIVLNSGERYNSTRQPMEMTHGIQCQCNEAGTINNTCDPHSGQCQCKSDIYSGMKCDRCNKGYYHHTMDGSDTKCYHCPCHKMYSGKDVSCRIVQGDLVKCNSCLAPYTGRLCHDCSINHYKSRNSKNQEVCLPCACNGFGDKSHSKGQCEENTGICRCVNNTGGRGCDQCKSGYTGIPGNCTQVTTTDPHVNTDIKPTETSSAATTGAIVGVCVVLGIILLAIAVYVARLKYLQWKRRPGQFWTVELSQDTEDLTFQTDQDWSDHNNTNDATMLINSNSYVGRFSAPPGEEPNPYMSITVS